MKNGPASGFPICQSLQVVGICAVLQMIGGCSSWLDIDEKTAEDVVSSGEPGGIALNRPQVYQVEIDQISLCGLAQAAPLGCTHKIIHDSLAGIDHHHLLIVNAARMPFSSATLTVEASDKQIAKVIGLESKTGVAGVPKSASAVLDAKAEREKLKLEAKEKEDAAKAQDGGS